MNGQDLGKLCIVIGLGIALLGVVIMVLSKFTSIGRLPGDIFIQGENGSFYFPVVSCIVISIVLSLIMNLFNR